MEKKITYGQHKFIVPDSIARKQALGHFIAKQSSSKLILEEAAKVFTPVDAPKEGNWLFSQKEPGQSYNNYQTSQHHKLDAQRKKIYIAPLETNIDKTFLDKLRIYCQAFYLGVQVVIHQQIDLKKYDIFINEQRNQYLIKNLTGLLKQIIPKDAFCMIGILMSDLYHRQDWNYLLGMGTKDRVGVFSFARYDDRFYKIQKYQHDYNKILEDAIGIMVHEITHMFGFKHCTFYNCLMNGIISVEESRIKPLELCPVCLRKLQSNCKFDLRERYEKIYDVMIEFCDGPRGKITIPMVKSIITKISIKNK